MKIFNFRKYIVRSCIAFLLCFIFIIGNAQKDKTGYDFDVSTIEDLLLENTDVADPDLIYIYETLQSFYENPLNLNNATYENLKEIPLLNELQIQQFILYKSKYGKLISIYELQSVPEFDLKTIRALLPFVKISGEDKINLSLGEMLNQSKQSIVMKWDRVLQTRRGFTIREGNTKPAYEGSPDHFVFRYIGNFENKLRFGMIAEKDAGESFFAKSNKQGFDHYSGHLFLKDYSKLLKTIALGDYQVSFGQGLIAYSGFSGNKGAEVMKIERSRRTLRFSSSLNETLFLRGAGITLGLSDKLEITAFGSSKKVDGNVLLADSIDLNVSSINDINITSSLQTSGNHRTVGEIEDEKQIRLTNFGGKIKYRNRNAHIAFNTIVHQLDKPIFNLTALYNKFAFEGDQLINASTDYGYFFRNINFFGETGWSDNGSIASVNGLLIGLDEKVSLSVYHRYLPKDFQSINSRVFAETSQGSNENGLYLGIEINPNKNWNIRAYFDAWKHPWLRYQVDSPSKGVEYFARVTYKKKRRLSAYFQLRNEIKGRNTKNPDAKIDYLDDNTRTQFRIHIANKISKSIELRSRAEWSIFDNEYDPIANGYLVYQDVIFKSITSPISFTTRFALFDTDNYNSRIYAYENDLLYTFYIPAYSGKGTRFYANFRYQPNRNWSIECRYERTFYNDRNVISSGNQEILGRVQSGVDVQVKYNF